MFFMSNISDITKHAICRESYLAFRLIHIFTKNEMCTQLSVHFGKCHFAYLAKYFAKFG